MYVKRKPSKYLFFSSFRVCAMCVCFYVCGSKFYVIFTKNNILYKKKPTQKAEKK